MDRNAFECGPGWYALIDPLVKRCLELGGTVDQIKEKLGGLRFYYTEHGAEPDAAWDRFQEQVLDAEDASKRTCELCGKEGRTLVKARWYKTLCKQHAKELGYKT